MADKPPKKTYPCLKCDEHVAKNAEAVQCMFCEFWIHKKCAGLTKEVFDFMVKTAKATGNVQYICTACTSTCTSLNKKISTMDKELKGVVKTVDENTRVIEKCMDTVEDLKKKMPDSEEVMAKTVEASNDCVFLELRDQQIRRKNIIIHNIPELEDNDPRARKAHDNDNLKEILKIISLSSIKEDDIKYMNRIGEKRQTDRPLLVSFRKQEHRDSVLEHARFLKSSKKADISLIPDLTKRQRKEEDDLRKEMRKKNEELNGEDHLNWEWRLVGIRGERKLVKMKKFQQRAEKENRPFRPGQHRQLTAKTTNPNLMPLGEKNRKRKPIDEDLSRRKKSRGGEEEEETVSESELETEELEGRGASLRSRGAERPEANN